MGENENVFQNLFHPNNLACVDDLGIRPLPRKQHRQDEHSLTCELEAAGKHREERTTEAGARVGIPAAPAHRDPELVTQSLSASVPSSVKWRLKPCHPQMPTMRIKQKKECKAIII